MKGLSVVLLHKAWVYWWVGAGHKPAVGPSSPESQPYPGLHPKMRSQRAKGGDPHPSALRWSGLSCSAASRCGVLSAGRHGAVRVHPEYSHKHEPKDGTPLL